MTWYEPVTKESRVLQGDLLPGVPLASLPLPSPEDVLSWRDPVSARNMPDEVPIAQIDLIVLSQSCDIEQNHIQNVLLAQYHLWSQVKQGPEFPQTGSGRRKRLLREETPEHRVLPPHDAEPHLGWSVVNFRSLFMLPRQYVEDFAYSLPVRLRITGAYKEGIVRGFTSWISRSDYTEQLEGFEHVDPGTG